MNLNRKLLTGSSYFQVYWPPASMLKITEPSGWNRMLVQMRQELTKKKPFFFLFILLGSRENYRFYQLRQI